MDANGPGHTGGVAVAFPLRGFFKSLTQNSILPSHGALSLPSLAWQVCYSTIASIRSFEPRRHRRSPFFVRW